MRNIKRTIESTVVEPVKVTFVEGQIVSEELGAITFIGKIKKEEVIKKLRKELDCENLMLQSYEVTEKTYEITPEAFIANAKEVVTQE